MKKLIYFLPLLILLVACTPKVPQVTQVVEVIPAKVELITYADTMSYLLGSTSADQLKSNIPEGANLFDKEMYLLGFEETYDEKNRLEIDEKQKQALFTKFQNQLQAIQAAEAEKLSAANKSEGVQYLAENAKKEGVMTTASGLQYKVLTAGTGVTPAAADQVEVHYEGRLIDGTVFDSSYKRGSTATFGVGQVISGWTEGLQLMKEGAKYQFFIPSNLAYGDRATGKIKPGDTLIFDVELIKVIK